MISFPNCKINLGLSVTDKRPDGFHNLETIMVPVSLSDVLEIIIAPDNQFAIYTTGINITGDNNNNLVVKAYKLLQAEYQLLPVKIHLHKIIPIGAGLGGGSSDAAFAILTLNKLFNLRLSISAMLNIASELGADCPFFIQNTTVLATERGDRFEPLNLSLKNYYFVIVKPNIFISTPEAYSWIKPELKPLQIHEIIEQPTENWKTLLKNDFENEVFNRFPEIKQIKDLLYKSGAIYASMSGSGSAVYGIFKEPILLQKKFPGYYYWAGMGL